MVVVLTKDDDDSVVMMSIFALSTIQPVATLNVPNDWLLQDITQPPVEIFVRPEVSLIVGLLFLIVIGWLTYQAMTGGIGRERTASKQRKRALWRYLAWVQARLRDVPMIPIRAARQHEPLQLQEVYVPLRVVEPAQMYRFRQLMTGDFDAEQTIEMRRGALTSLGHSQGVYQLLSDEPENGSTPRHRVLLVGEAGSGKTTTLQYGALVLAHALQQHSTEMCERELGLRTQESLVPIYVRLTQLARYLRQRIRQEMETNEGYQNNEIYETPVSLFLTWLDETLRTEMDEQESGLPVPSLAELITKGRCLLLLDGLDETGDGTYRAYIQRLVQCLADEYPQNRYLVATRPFDRMQIAGFQEYHVSPLNTEEMYLLLRRWFGAVHSDITAAERQVVYLWNTLDRNASLFEMGTNPLLLTSMAMMVYTGGVRLRSERAELYNRLIDLLLENWRLLQKYGGVPQADHDHSARFTLVDNPAAMKRHLQAIAAWMQWHQRRDICLEEAQNLLRPTYQKLMPWSREECNEYIRRVLQSLALESGLLQQRYDGYSFTHYTLQEYLVMRAYDQRKDGVDRLYTHWNELHWRDILLLAIGHWTTNSESDPSRARRFLRRLLDEQAENIEAIQLARTALDEVQAEHMPYLKELRDEAVQRLGIHAAFDPVQRPDRHKRNELAMQLDRAGADNRPSLQLDQPDYWAKRIEPGPFQMGSRGDAPENEQPSFLAHIQKPFAIARFPVTNRQYAQFLEDLEREGHVNEVTKHRPETWVEGHYPPGMGNHPVVNVSWVDACAFAQWAHRYLQRKGVLQSGELIRIPTELEWERAAAYPVIMPSGQPDAGRRDYPWDPDWFQSGTTSMIGGIPANTRESGFLKTSVVGIFPYSAAECGAEELAGNVWEWCSTPYTPYPLPHDLGAEDNETSKTHEYRKKTYVLRGGSWYFDHTYARCTSRLALMPDLKREFYGFRLVRVSSQ